MSILLSSNVESIRLDFVYIGGLGFGNRLHI